MVKTCTIHVKLLKITYIHLNLIINIYESSINIEHDAKIKQIKKRTSICK